VTGPEPCRACTAGVHVFCDGIAADEPPRGEPCPCCPNPDEEKK